MTTSDFAVQILTAAFVSLLGSGFLVWIVRSWISEKLKNAIKSEYDLRLETHKAQLKAEADLELEKLRSQLALEAKEHDVVFSKLHEKRGEVIAEIYAKLKRVQRHLGEYTKAFEFVGEKPRTERGKELMEAHRVFFDTFDGNAIFLPDQLAKAIEEFNRLIVVSSNEFSFLVMPGDYPDRHKKWIEINERIDKVLPDALSKLEREFRALLGYKDEDDQG